MGATALARDVADAEIHLLDTGHFALEEELPAIAPLVAGCPRPGLGVTAAVHNWRPGYAPGAMAQQQLWLLRHGEAVPHESKPDFERELTARGERQSAAAGAALARLGQEFAACYTSPLLRAAGTARLACDALNVAPEERDALGKDFDVGAARELLAEHEDGAHILLVGHNPSFAQVVLDLTGARVDFKKGGVAAMRVSGGRGELLALMRPRELESLALDALPGRDG